MSYLIGIDGGGTRTTVVLADLDGTERHRHRGAAALVDPRAPARSAEVVARLIREATAAAGLRGPAAALCAGLAGVEHAADRRVVTEALQAERLAARVSVVSDGHVAVEGALGTEPGLLLLAGTGSIAYARASDGTVTRCGGWGLVLGDEGSAYDLGRRALTAALWAHDGRGRATSLLDALLTHVVADTPRGLPSWAGRVSKAEIAALAPLVVEHADAGDAVAQTLLAEAAQSLASHLPPLVDRLANVPPPVPLVYLGGMFRLNGFDARVTAAAGQLLPGRVAVGPARSDAVTGAVRVAQKLTHEPVPESQG